MMAESNPKFRVKADLVVFEALQQYGKMSEEGIARQSSIPATTVHYAVDRIKARRFFEIKAVPQLERFSEVPMAVIGFTSVHPVKLGQLKEKLAQVAEVVQLFHTDRDVVLFVMGSSMESLTRRLHDIMKYVDEEPCIYMTSPIIAKYNVTIPDKVLESVYRNLPDKRIKV